MLQYKMAWLTNCQETCNPNIALGVCAVCGGEREEADPSRDELTVTAIIGAAGIGTIEGWNCRFDRDRKRDR